MADEVGNAELISKLVRAHRMSGSGGSTLYGDAADALAASEARAVALAARIEAAPHARGCPAPIPMMYHAPWDCLCWKSARSEAKR